MKTNQRLPDLTRRTFLKGGSFSTLMSMLGGVPLVAQEQPKPAALDAIPVGRIVKCAVIGVGPWGREILSTLARIPEANVVSVCDTYPAMVRRGQQLAPNAKTTADYRTILADKEVEAVLIATPTHQHREIAVAAMKAGKHVYCEAPIAHTIDDARAIAKAARDAFKIVFQAGLQARSHPQRHFLLQFIRAGAMGRPVMVRAQWHKKQSWRFASPNPDREKEINWRLDKKVSPGLIGELGIHQLDTTGWFLDFKPVAVSGFGALIHWKDDGREVPDTVQAVLEYPGGVNLVYHSTIANSFETEYEVYYGSDSAILVRDDKAWMFKEVDAPLLGWEVYARKDSFHKETGIALVMDASKSAKGQGAAEDPSTVVTPLQHSLAAFLGNAGKVSQAVEDFTKSFGDDAAALKEYLADPEITKGRLSAAGYKEGFESLVIALKTNEAILGNKRLVFSKEWFALD